MRDPRRCCRRRFLARSAPRDGDLDGQGAPEISALPARLAPLAAKLRAAGGWIVSTHFTLVPGRRGAPFISPHLQRLRPFLRAGDFAPGSWGNALVDELAPADISVEKVAYSAFYMSRLEWVLARAGVRCLLVAGIVTNGGVASTNSYAAASNQLTQIAGGQTIPIASDANGSITNNGNNQFTYDARGRLVSAVTPTGLAQYTVNALGQRVQKTTASGNTVFEYDSAGKLIGETNGTNGKDYIYLGDIPVSVVQM